MNNPQAKSVLALLSAAFPREPMPRSTVELWANSMLDVGYEDAKEAVSELVLDVERMPSLSALLLACRRVRIERNPALPDATPKGPTLQEWLDENPDYRKRVDAIATGAPEQERTSRKTPKNLTRDIREKALELDRAQSKQPRKRSKCVEHEFFMRDRCFWCGVKGVLEA